MNNKLLIISGYTSSGKNTVVEKLIKKYKFKNIVSTTTRPIRKNEIDGVDYFFTSKENFQSMLSNDEFVETRSYNTIINVNGKNEKDTWYYGIHKNEFENSNTQLTAIVDKQGAIDLINYYGEDNCVWIYLGCDENILKSRCLSRGDYIEEVNRRIHADKKAFKGIEELVHATINTEQPIDSVIEQIMEVYNYYN